jgi:sRNA-binding carbon storage regulator CsrA
MKKFINKILNFGSKAPKKASISREQLQKKVETGTERAVKEYGYVFKKLAEFDRV